MKSKHTPGPWYHYNFHDKLEVGTHGPVNHVICADVKDEANARLIAASPKLLEALKICFESFQAPDDLTLKIRAIAEANAAITIAGGKE